MMSEDRPLNPNVEYSQDEIDDMMGMNDDCPYCDEGFVYDCIDGQCIDVEIGCDFCTRPCEFCND